MVTYKIFGDYSEAREIYEILTQNGIDTELEDNSERFNPSFTSTPFSKEFRIKLNSTDFEKATFVLREAMKTDLSSVESDYYLFSFLDSELKEILVKPDEWSFFDYFLAEKLLEQKGTRVDSQEILKDKQQRIEELSKPEKRPLGLIIFGYIFSLGFIGLLFGWLLFNSKKTLFTGETVFTYSEHDRMHGFIIFGISIVSLIFLSLRLLLII